MAKKAAEPRKTRGSEEKIDSDYELTLDQITALDDFLETAESCAAFNELVERMAAEVSHNASNKKAVHGNYPSSCCPTPAAEHLFLP